jgi:hypothetical protein
MDVPGNASRPLHVLDDLDWPLDVLDVPGNASSAPAGRRYTR